MNFFGDNEYFIISRAKNSDEVYLFRLNHLDITATMGIMAESKIHLEAYLDSLSFRKIELRNNTISEEDIRNILLHE